ncbi:hypothetical protein [Acidovorax sp. Root217]|uniref:hypothetical protein n=1 Tax=Acidovorax sp. Root217 TaxID=1736492 RepID=UPI0012FBF447|nr:hypothetical protein [Acidovorax sp. Root217]
MIGLIVLLLAGTWLLLAGTVAKRVAKFLFPERFAVRARVLLFPLILCLPFLDEIIGRWQFHTLCEREAKVWIAPNAKEVTAAREGDSKTHARVGFLIPVTEQPIVFMDALTGKTFYATKAFHTPGGAIMRAGLNLGSTSSCWPKNWTARENGIDIDTLLKRGEALEKEDSKT